MSVSVFGLELQFRTRWAHSDAAEGKMTETDDEKEGGS